MNCDILKWRDKMEKVCSVLDVPEGKMKGFTVGLKYILIANFDGNFYALDAVCPHRGGYLPVGKLEQENLNLSCPWCRVRYNNWKTLKRCE